MSTRFRLIAALVLGFPVTVILAGTIVPPFWMWQIPLSIGGTELAPIWLLTGLLTLGLSWRSAASFRRIRLLGLGLASWIILLSALTLVQIPGAWASAEIALNRGLSIAGKAAPGAATLPGCDFVQLAVGIRVPQSTVMRGIALGDSAGTVLYGDVYRPPGTAVHPIVIAIHGGGWNGGNRSEGETFSWALASAGFVVVSCDYRLAPAVRFPAQLADMALVLRWVAGHASEIGGDPQRVALFGRSAGAQLALLTAAAGDPSIKAVIGFYSPVDLAEGWRNPGWPDPLNARAVFHDYLGGTLAELPEAYRRASPITYTDRPLPPTLLIYGGRDHLVYEKFGRLLAERLRAGGTPTVMFAIPWSEHAFDAIPHGLGGQLALHYLTRFLTATLN